MIGIFYTMALISYTWFGAAVLGGIIFLNMDNPSKKGAAIACLVVIVLWVIGFIWGTGEFFGPGATL